MPDESNIKTDAGVADELLGTLRLQQDNSQEYYFFHRDTLGRFFFEVSDKFAKAHKWQIWLSAFGAFLVPLVTADFKPTFGIPADAIYGAVLFAAVYFGIMLVKDGLGYWKQKDEFAPLVLTQQLILNCAASALTVSKELRDEAADEGDG